MINRQSTDQEIITNLKAGGSDRRKAEDVLFTTYSYFIREGTTKHSLSEDESFDAYSDTILSAIQTIANDTFRGGSTLKTYLYQIFYNKCVDLIRKKSTNKNSVHHTLPIGEMFHLSDLSKPVLDQLMLKYDWEDLKKKLNQLGENCRKILLLSTDGYSSKEIQEALGFKTADVVKTSRLRCIEKLRQLYKAA